MILTCPDCATRYFVEDARIGPQGRKVRCAACGVTWREMAPPEPEELSPQPQDATILAKTDPDPDPALETDDRPHKAPDVPKRLREAAAEKRKTQEAVAVGVVWAGLGAGFCALVLIAVIFKADVVRLIPSTAGAYAFARMPVNPTGLAIEAQGAPGLVDGHAALTISGVERNVEGRPRLAVPLRVSLLDKEGKRLLDKLAVPAPGPIAPGETRPFSLSFLDPPLAMASSQVEVAFDAIKPPPHGAPRAQHSEAKTSVVKLAPPPVEDTVLPPIEAKDAAPLPANSPYALPSEAVTSPVPAPEPDHPAHAPVKKTHG